MSFLEYLEVLANAVTVLGITGYLIEYIKRRINERNTAFSFIINVIMYSYNETLENNNPNGNQNVNKKIFLPIDYIDKIISLYKNRLNKSKHMKDSWEKHTKEISSLKLNKKNILDEYQCDNLEYLDFAFQPTFEDNSEIIKKHQLFFTEIEKEYLILKREYENKDEENQNELFEKYEILRSIMMIFFAPYNSDIINFKKEISFYDSILEKLADIGKSWNPYLTDIIFKFQNIRIKISSLEDIYNGFINEAVDMTWYEDDRLEYFENKFISEKNIEMYPKYKEYLEERTILLEEIVDFYSSLEVTFRRIYKNRSFKMKR